MSNEKMNKEERKTAELAVMNLHEAVGKLKDAYECVRNLLCKYGWDIDYDNISKAAMIAGMEALDIVDSIADMDGWEHHVSRKEVRDAD